MNDSRAMRFAKGRCGLGIESKRSFPRQGAFAIEDFIQRFSFEPLHCTIEPAIASLAEVMQGHEIGMRQSRESSRFSTKPSGIVGGRGVMSRKDFDGHFALQIDVFRLENMTHGPFADLSKHSVASPRQQLIVGFRVSDWLLAFDGGAIFLVVMASGLSDELGE